MSVKTDQRILIDRSVFDLTSGGRAESEHVCQRRDDVDGEADKESTDGGVDWTEERKDNGEEPNGHYHRKPCCGSFTHAVAVMHADCFLPDEVERRARESEGYDLTIN